VATCIGRSGELSVLHFSSDVWAALERLGETPLPPYITAWVDPSRYQTVYAQEKGSVAAPTAGLHFTLELLERIAGLGVEIVELVLHVGPGTFRPVQGPLNQHRMHPEHYLIPPDTAAAINSAKAQGRRIIAVGTTTVRALEAAVLGREVQAGPGITELFIRPGYRFRMIDALVTNFHLPNSTLLMLVAAFAGYHQIRHAYTVAVAEQYRFYSLGDAMFIEAAVDPLGEG